MHGMEIRKRIEENNKIIESLMTPNVFTLNNTIADLITENREFQNQCTHEFEDGFCVYCMKGENLDD